MPKCEPFKSLVIFTLFSITSRIIIFVVRLIVNVCNCLFSHHVQVTPTYTIRLWGCFIVPMFTHELYTQSYVFWLVLVSLVPDQTQVEGNIRTKMMVSYSWCMRNIFLKRWVFMLRPLLRFSDLYANCSSNIIKTLHTSCRSVSRLCNTFVACFTHVGTVSVIGM